jgi:hypothetical protein
MVVKPGRSRPCEALSWDRRSATEGPGVLCDELLSETEDGVIGEVEDEPATFPGRGPGLGPRGLGPDDEAGAALSRSRGCAVGST